MKRFYIGAATLMLGTSALALAQTSKDAVATTDNKPMVTMVDGKKAFDTAWYQGVEAKLQTASFDAKGAGLGDAKLQSASWVEGADKTALAVDPKAKVQMAAVDQSWNKTAAIDPDAKLTMASADKTVTADTGMGGPLEEADMTAASLTTRPAQSGYPHCTPGEGDDNCIQLYEPGVRARLASWKSESGGLADGSAGTAIGGPFEPVEIESGAAAGAAAMAGDATIEPAKGELAHVELGGADVAAHSQYSGVGGPIEAQAGYPPCSPGPGDDRCIQLYEAGVSGAGN